MYVNFIIPDSVSSLSVEFTITSVKLRNIYLFNFFFEDL